jgi:hypothetical protein
VNWLDAAPFWERLVFGLAGGALVWWAAVDLGAAAFSAIGLEDRARSPQSAALGYALVGTAVGVLGLLHAIWAWVVLGLMVVRFAVQCVRERRFALSFPSGAKSAFKELPALDKVAVIVAGCAWLTGGVAAALPATWWDPLAYHLPILARAVEAHTFAVDPSMLQTSFVLLGEAAALPAFIVGGTAGAAFATLGAGIVLVLICARWAQAVAAGSGPIAMALVSCCALWIWLAPSFYVDIPFAMFAIGALLVAVESSNVRSGVALAAGGLAGAAAATKYTGLVIVVVALVALLVARGGVKASDVARFSAAAIALAGAWFLRTALATGDPVFPFLSTSAPGAVGLFAQRYVSMTRSWCGGGTSASDAVMLPWRLLTSPKTFCGDPGYALDVGSIFVLASLSALRRTAVVLTLCLALTIVWFESSQQLRFLVPAVCLFAVAAAAGTVVAGPRLRVAGQTVLLALCAVGIAVDWIPGRLDASNGVAPAFAYIAGAQSGDDYLTSRLEFYGAVRWVRDNGGGRVVALDDVRDYYFGSFATWFNPYYQPSAIDWTLPSDRRYAPLKAAGFRYLVVNANSAYVDRTPTGVDWRTLDRDAGDGALRPVFSRDEVTVFAFGRARPASKP